MATQAATGRIVASAPCESPDGVTPASVKPGGNHAVVNIETVYAPSMKVPRYKMSGGGAVTIGAFKYCNVVLPVTMLKEHIESDAIRTTPEDAERDGPSDIDRVLAAQHLHHAMAKLLAHQQ
jgi:hypothetical protein